MDYEELRKYQRKEKNTAKLVELDSNFYKEVSDYVSELESQYQDGMDPQIKKKIENIRKIIKDLHRKRERKIFSRVLGSSKSVDEFNLLEREREFFEELTKAVEEERRRLDSVLQGENPTTGVGKEPEEEREEAEKTSETNEGTEAGEENPSIREEKKKSQETYRKNDEEIEEPDEGLNKVMVKILKEVPEFVSQNLQKLGPYQPNTKVEVPEEEAEILSKKGLAEKIHEPEE